MMNKAIFLDRDGVLLNNRDHYYIWKPDQMTFVEGVFGNLRLLANRGFHLFVVSNQGGISKGIYTREDTEKLHAEMLRKFRSEGITIAEVVYCPHHPEVEKCLCRKPSPVMISKLMAKYQIDPKQSYMIGDSETDMEAARLAGIGGIKVEANQNMYPFISFLVE